MSYLKNSIAVGLVATSALTAWAQSELNKDGYYDGEGIRYDAATEKYEIKYLSYVGGRDTFVTLYYEAPNKIKPALNMHVRSSFKRDVVYEFNVSNGRQAKQAIYAFSAYMQAPWFENSSWTTHSAASRYASTGNVGSVTQAIESTLAYTTSVEEKRMMQPAKWLPDIKFAKTNKAFVMSWQAHPNKLPLDDIRPGQSRTGFGIAVPYLPGLAAFNFAGDAPSFGFPGPAGGDSKIWKDIDKLTSGKTAPLSPILSLGPKVLIPEPYNTKLLAAAIADDLASWTAAGQLSEPLAQRLRAHFIAMGDAAERNNPAGVLGNAQQIFQELFVRHPGMKHTECGEHNVVVRPDQAELSYLAARGIGFNTFELLKRHFYSVYAGR